MSTAREVERAVSILDQHDIALMHTCSTYPSRTEELNLRVIATLRDRYGIPVGYSGHEGGILSSIASVALGASIVERHITLDRNMWGSDQAASIEVDELRAMVRGIREIEMALGESTKRLLPSEVPVLEKLRRVGAVVQVAS
jgi:N-acetylneuraminate synthase